MAKAYSNLEIRYIRLFYPDGDTALMAKALGRNINSIRLKASSLGVKKSLDFRKKEAVRLGKNTSTQFKRGHNPHNKGAKGWFAPGAENHWFKKGHTPHNTKWDGAERISKEGYIEVRVSKGNYQLKHKIIWEAENGPYNGKKYCLWFKNRNRQDCRLENLELVTRSEAIIRTRNTNEFILSKYLGVKGAEDQKKVMQVMPAIVKVKKAELLIQKKLKNETNRG